MVLGSFSIGSNVVATAFWIGIGALALGGFVLLTRWYRRWRISRDQANLQAARAVFHQRREWLEARFVTLASHSGKPRGLSWVECDFQNGVHFARDRHTGQFRALVGLTIRFEAVVGGDLEDNPNVHNLREATAVFRMERSKWVTDGKAVFNLNPEETIRHYHHELEDLDVVTN